MLTATVYRYYDCYYYTPGARANEGPEYMSGQKPDWLRNESMLQRYNGFQIVRIRTVMK